MQHLTAMYRLVDKLPRTTEWRGNSTDGALQLAACAVQFSLAAARGDDDEMLIALAEGWNGFVVILHDQGLDPQEWQQRAEEVEADLNEHEPTLDMVEQHMQTIEQRLKAVRNLTVGSTRRLEVECDILTMYCWRAGIAVLDALAVTREGMELTVEEQPVR